MTKEKRACPGIGVPGQARQEAAAWQGTTSTANHNTSGENRQFRIADLLPTGQENAVPLRHLKGLTGLDGRTIRLMIEQERRAGVPLLSDNKHGYFMAADTRERDRFVRSMRGRAAEIEAVAAAVERAVIE